jgi:chloramphenicol-sensitive protein RarD
VPIYWKQLKHIDSYELIAHRHVWSLLVVLVLVVLQRGAGAVVATLQQPRLVATNLLSSLLLTTNWLIYVIGVNTGHVTECSLGYFLVPLVNVATGRFVLHEQLRPLQWLAIASAAVGVALMFVQLGQVPWIALALAGSWGAYSLMRKQTKLSAVTGLAVETLLLAPFALGYLIWRQVTGEGVLGHADATTQVLVMNAGLITAIPLLLFAYGARRIQLSTLGLLQYVSPSIQLLLAASMYGESFSVERAYSFAFIWIGLVLYSADSLRAQRSARQ